MVTSRSSRPSRRRSYPPRARDGQPFQLANPDLVHALEPLSEALQLLRDTFPQHPPEVVKHVEKHLKLRGFDQPSWAVRTYPLELILEAINRFEKDRADGLTMTNPGGYLHILIKQGVIQEIQKRLRELPQC